MPSISGIAIKHSSAINGACSGEAAVNNAEAIVVPTPLRFVNAVNACSKFGNLRNARFVSWTTARGVLILIRFSNCLENFPRYANETNLNYNIASIARK